MSLFITLFGPPGSGKGTQAKKIVAMHNVAHISTGELFRKCSHGSDDLAIHVRRLLAEGLFVPDPTTIRVFEETLQSAVSPNGCVFDGYPRNMVQMTAFENFLKKTFPDIPNTVVFIDVDEQELRERILGKRAFEECRSDDIDASFKKRMDLYHNNTLPVIQEYERLGSLKKVVGTGRQSEDVWLDVQKIIADSVCHPVL